MTRTRVLVVEDSPTVRRHLVQALTADASFEVVGETGDGRAAVALCQSLRPDVVTMDIMLQSMNGVAATEEIMAWSPTPILVVSSADNRGEAFRTYDALAAGAVDALEKPTSETAVGWEDRLRASVRLVSRVKVITHPRARLAHMNTATLQPPPRRSACCSTVAIGASTGGPSAVCAVLSALPPAFAPPVLVVIHIGPGFAARLADWLSGQTRHRVALAEDGQPVPRAGERRVVLAPPGRHLVVERGRLRLSDAPERHSCRPSVDALFESVAAEAGPGALGCLLTGMGKDGAAGLLAIRRAGGVTIAQDAATSVVYGMPAEAVAMGAAQHVLPLGRIADAIVAAVAKGAEVAT